MLCGVSVVFNSLGDVLGLMCCKCNSEKGQVLIGFQSTEAFGCLHHAGGGPAQGGSKPGERRGGRRPGSRRKLILAGDKITALGKDRLAELDEWAYGVAKKYAPKEDEKGRPYWDHDGDETRFM